MRSATLAATICLAETARAGYYFIPLGDKQLPIDESTSVSPIRYNLKFYSNRNTQKEKVEHSIRSRVIDWDSCIFFTEFGYRGA